jgi:nucleoside-diphosphate-sugar epimerase
MVIGITGASGFIGSALVGRQLEAGHTVRCLTRRPQARWHTGVDVVEGDLANPDDRLARFADGLDVLYHCAAEVVNAQQMRAVNVDGVQALLRAAAGRIGRWVQLSSVGVYGPHSAGILTEQTALAPRGPYETSKAAADVLVLDAWRQRRFASCAILRPSIVFGAGMPNQSIAHMMRMIERGLFFYIGRPGASANYVHVSNVIDALALCGTAEADAPVYNLSDWCTIEEFAGAIACALRVAPPRLRIPEQPVRCATRVVGRLITLPLTESRVNALVNRSRYSIERIRRELKYAPSVSIAEGLAHMVAMKAAA